MIFDDREEINEYIRIAKIIKENLKDKNEEDALDATIKAIENDKYIHPTGLY